MAGLLTDFLAAGLIEKLEGDDERFAKIERAAATVTKELHADPPALIRAILAGLDPDVPANDPAIARAQRALVAEWKSISSVHTSPPVGLFRAILLEACSQVAEGDRAAILWLTAADTLPLRHLGREESVVRQMLTTLAERAEAAALWAPSIGVEPSGAEFTVRMERPIVANAPMSRKVNRENLLLKIAAAAFSNYRNNANGELVNPNHYQVRNQPAEWSWHFSDRMRDAVSDELDELASDIGKRQIVLGQQLSAAQSALVAELNGSLASQRQWVLNALSASEARQQADQLRLNALWWSEALYSESMRCSYRELPVPLSIVVMAVDLLDQVTKPSPASVAYLLAEAVYRLPEADLDRERALVDVLGALRDARGRLPNGWMDRLRSPPAEGRISLRDLIVLSLGAQDRNLATIMNQAGLSENTMLSLPALARALFRQEQAARLAESCQ